MRSICLSVLLGVALFTTPAFAQDLCATLGYSGHTTNVRSCTSGPNQRTIACNAGFVVMGVGTPTITLQGNAPFTYCVSATDLCAVYGYSNKPQNTLSCTSAPNQRTLKCGPGYHVAGTSSDSIVLTGNAVFPGCTKLGPVNVAPVAARPTFTGCALYGTPGKPPNTNSCVSANDQYTITCKDGYVVTGTAQPTITIQSTAKFAGCSPSACTQYGYSSQDANTASCTNGVNQRTITCQSGYLVKGTTNASITLTGSAAFAGCAINCGDHNNDGHRDCGKGNVNGNRGNR